MEEKWIYYKSKWSESNFIENEFEELPAGWPAQENKWNQINF